jgi:hypothetical protein
MLFTIADLQHRLPIAAPSYDGRTCSRRSANIGNEIPDDRAGSVFTRVVSIGQQWDDNRIVAYIYRGANGHFFFDRLSRNGHSVGEIVRIDHALSARNVTACIPRVRRRT